VVHHDFCRDHCAPLVAFIEQLNALACPLHWHSLGDLVRRSCRQRVLSADVMQVEMYGKELLIENCSDRTKQFLVRRRESDPSSIREVRAGSSPISWRRCGDQIQFDLELKGWERVIIHLDFLGLDGAMKPDENLNYTA